MYQPPHFREDDRATQIALIRAHPLGLLVTAEASGPVANLVPFLPVEEDGSTRLLGHVARANPQWKAIRDGAPVLVVFQGVDTYITPSWYETKRETGKVVPTWNYAVVQVRGRARAVEDRDWLRRQVGLITDAHEAPRPDPWSVADAPEAFVAAQLRGIVGIEIEVAAIEGKWKVSQNRPAADIDGVVEGLEAASGSPDASTMAALVRGRGPS
jgi:transcriptional regulator